MKLIKSSITGLVFFLLLIVELTIGFSSLTIANIPRMLLPIKSIKKSLAKFSNIIGDLTVIGFKYIMIFIHGNKIQIINDETLSTKDWYLGISNHQSWADIFIILASSNYKIPLIRFFMKKELKWVPFVYLANKCLNMPFVNRHSKEDIEKNPDLQFQDYKNTIAECKRLTRAPATIFSYAEGTRNTKEKHAIQQSPYKNLLKPKIGGIATALSAVTEIEYLLDFSLIYKSDKRNSWSFLNGDMRDVKVLIKKYKIPENLKNKNYFSDQDYRKNFKNWIEEIWAEKDLNIEKLKF